MKIVHKNGVDEGVFLVEDNGKIIGEMTYIWAEGNSFVINHTSVNSSYQDQGVGQKMIASAVQYARNNNFKITPVCSFARGVFNNTPAYDDVKMINTN